VGRRWLLWAVVAGAALAPLGCGSDEKVSDDEIVDALRLEPSKDTGGYAIGGDPFCEVSDELLNDSDEVDAASKGDKLGLVISDSEQSVGVEAVPPFDPKCAKKAKRALNRL
jgi:hypothetical protein